MTVSAIVTVVAQDGTSLFSGQRSASAGYQLDSQVLADSAAATEAAERAAIALAETVRLTILSALARS